MLEQTRFQALRQIKGDLLYGKTPKVVTALRYCS